MYHLEERKAIIDVKSYMEDCVDVGRFLKYCEACRCYGKVWSCPPYDFDPEEYWKKYSSLHLIGTKIVFDGDSEHVIQGSLEEYVDQVFTREKALLYKKMRDLEEKYPGGVSLSAGNCHLCDQCTRVLDEGCLHPEDMRYSIESLGGNVEKTARELLEIELKWTEGKLPEYLTLVNGFLTNDPSVEI